MGNSSSRRAAAKPNESRKAEQAVKLAPRQQSGDCSRNAECPICFVTYHSFNVALCCKQQICTDCYLQLKADRDPPCPFCGITGFVVHFDESLQSASNSSKPSGDESKEYPAGSTQSPSISTKSNASTPPTYLTPEQDRKLRASSHDFTLPMASKADREALEAEIRGQRNQFLVDDIPSRHTFHSTSVSDVNRSTVSRRSSDPSASPRAAGRTTDTWRPRAAENAQFDSIPHYRYGRRVGSVTPPPPPSIIASVEADDTVLLREESTRLIATLQSILGSQEVHRVPSLEQLEELMLMEAIRQSMQQASVAADREIITNNDRADGNGNGEVVHETSSEHNPHFSSTDDTNR